jgi:hypothetical protein
MTRPCRESSSRNGCVIPGEALTAKAAEEVTLDCHREGANGARGDPRLGFMPIFVPFRALRAHSVWRSGFRYQVSALLTHPRPK